MIEIVDFEKDYLYLDYLYFDYINFDYKHFDYKHFDYINQDQINLDYLYFDYINFDLNFQIHNFEEEMTEFVDRNLQYFVVDFLLSQGNFYLFNLVNFDFDTFFFINKLLIFF